MTRRRWLQRAAGAAGAGALAGWLPGPVRADAAPYPLPAPLPARPIGLPPMPLHHLGNGLAVLVVPRPELPVVSAHLVLRVGAALDPPGLPGVAAMTATLLGKGALRGGRPVGAAQLSAQAEALGGLLHTDSGWRHTSVGLQVLTPRLPAALALLADVLRQPLLAEDELVRARAQALDNLQLAMGNPADLAAMAVRRVFWGATAYGAVVTPAALRALQLADVQTFHALHARPEHAALVLAGDVSPERAVWLAQQMLGDWAPSGALLPQVPAHSPQPLAQPLVLVDLPGSGQSAVQLAAPHPASQASDRQVGLVANAVLGGAYSSRLNQTVRIQRGLSYGAYSDIESQPAGGMLVARTQTQHSSAAEVLALMRAELQRLAAAPPPADELAARQASLVGNYARRLQTVQGLAQLVLDQWLQGRPLAGLQRHVAALQAVTPAQVQDFARRHWAPAQLRAVVVGDLAAADAGLGPLAQAGSLRLGLAELDLQQPGLRAVSAPSATLSAPRPAAPN